MNIQINYTTKKEYTGNNQEMLQEVKEEMGYTSNEWMTFIQARNSGFKVKAGEKAVKLVRVGKYEKTEEGKTKESRFIRTFPVFNKDQVQKKGILADMKELVTA
jgi:antirestriction protein ArdC